jgi:hypothetical protein
MITRNIQRILQQSILTYVLVSIRSTVLVESKSAPYNLSPLFPFISSVVNNNYQIPRAEAFTTTTTTKTTTTSTSTSTTGSSTLSTKRIEESNNVCVNGADGDSKTCNENDGNGNVAFTSIAQKKEYRDDTETDTVPVQSIEIILSESMTNEPVTSTINMNRPTPTTKSKSKVTKPNNLSTNLLSIYLNLLAEHEVLTKSITSGIIGIICDFLAQGFEYKMTNKQKYNNHNNNHIRNGLGHAFTLDRIRLFGIFFESTLISGPLMHYAYDYMEHLVPVHDDDDNEEEEENNDNNSKKKNSMSKWTAASIHVFADVTILGPIFVFTMMLFTSIIEGRITTFISELGLDFGPALKASTVTSLGFVPIQLLAFKYLPIKFRLLYMNLQDVVWNAVVSVMAHKSRK